MSKCAGAGETGIVVQILISQGWLEWVGGAHIHDSKAGQSRCRRNTAHMLRVHKTPTPGEVEYAGSRADESRNQADASTVSNTSIEDGYWRRHWWCRHDIGRWRYEI